MISKYFASSSTIAIAIVVASLLALLGWFMLSYKPGQETLGTLRTEIGDLEQKKQIGTNAQANIGQLCDNLSTLRVEQQAFIKQLPPTEKFSKLLEELRTNIQNSKSTLLNVSRNNSSNNKVLPEGVRSVELKLGIESKFDGFYNILRSIEKMNRFSKIENVTLGVDGEPSSYDPNLKTDLNMTAYVYDNPKTLELNQPDPLCQSRGVSMSGGKR